MNWCRLERKYVLTILGLSIAFHGETEEMSQCMLVFHINLISFGCLIW
jgi:hypothetical protein